MDITLVMAERERAGLRAIAAAGQRLIEASDIGCAALLDGRPHAAGPFVNVCNEGTLAGFAPFANGFYHGRDGAARIAASSSAE
jgi:hypothetical protein